MNGNGFALKLEMLCTFVADHIFDPKSGFLERRDWLVVDQVVKLLHVPLELRLRRFNDFLTKILLVHLQQVKLQSDFKLLQTIGVGVLITEEGNDNNRHFAVNCLLH